MLVLIAHLLKWQFQPERRTRSWLVTIRRERSNIAQRSAILQVQAMGSSLELVYLRAVRQAAKETGLAPGTFPRQCPYSIERLRDHDWLPD